MNDSDSETDLIFPVPNLVNKNRLKSLSFASNLFHKLNAESRVEPNEVEEKLEKFSDETDEECKFKTRLYSGKRSREDDNENEESKSILKKKVKTESADETEEKKVYKIKKQFETNYRKVNMKKYGKTMKVSKGAKTKQEDWRQKTRSNVGKFGVGVPEDDDGTLNQNLILDQEQQLILEQQKGIFTNL